MKDNIFVHDVEALLNCFTVVFVPIEEGNDTPVEFVIHYSRNDSVELFRFLDEVKGLVGFNSLRYDYPLLHWMMENRTLLINHSKPWELIYRQSQRIIDMERSEIPSFRVKIAQCDLYRIYHYDNKMKRTSLKWVQCSINWHDVREMPLRHDSFVTERQLKDILSYNLNDVLSTKALYLHSKTRKAIDLRKKLGKKYKIRMLNYNDVRIGESIILKKLVEQGIVLKKGGTPREYIDLDECILPYIAFDSPQFNRLLDEMKDTRIVDTKGEFKYSTIFKGVVYDYGTGGLHACGQTGTFNANDREIIISSDVKSYYPNLSIQNDFYPEHLGIKFCSVYNGVYIERTNYPKGTPENIGLKFGLNGPYGKSNEERSYLYDPKFMMKITINGQLLLSMLCEQIELSGIGRVLMANTDGIAVKLSKEREQDYLKLCKEWEELTNLVLEHDYYKKIGIGDVNNYMALYNDGKVHSKGDYELLPEEERDFHKDNSQTIVKKAVHEYFINGTPVEQTIRNSNNIYDFLISKRIKSDAHFKSKKIENGEIVYSDLPKTVRFFVSTSGVGIVRINNETGEETRMISGYYLTLANICHGDMPNNINYRYYVREANKLIRRITHSQQILAL